MVEFALIAFPFFFLLGGVVEMAFLMLSSNSLQSAVQGAGEDLDRGIIANDANSFREAICSRLPAIMSCEESLIVDVRSVSDWTTFSGNAMIAETFPAAAGSDDLFVRVTYSWPIVFPSALLGIDLHNDQGDFLMAATTVMR